MVKNARACFVTSVIHWVGLAGHVGHWLIDILPKQTLAELLLHTYQSLQLLDSYNSKIIILCELESLLKSFQAVIFIARSWKTRFYVPLLFCAIDTNVPRL